MAQHAKKSANTQTSSQPRPADREKTSPAFQTIGAMQQAESKVLEMGRDNMENLMRTTDSFSHVATECMGICSDNLGALIESGSKASRILQNFSSEIMESCNRAISDYAEISKEAFACRTVNDMVALQNRAMQQIFDNYFATANKLSGMLFDSCSEALEPINERTAVASDQIRKALAA